MVVTLTNILKNIKVIAGIIVLCMVLIIVLQHNKIVKLNRENIILTDKISNPQVVKEPSITVKTVSKTINLTDKERKEITDKFGTEINQLTGLLDWIDNVLRENSIEVTREGKVTYGGSGASQPITTINKPKNCGISVNIIPENVSLSLNYRIYKQLSAGVSINDKFKMGANIEIRF